MNASGFGFHSTAEEVTATVDLRGKTWLVTGINSGIGKESARVLALRGARVIGAARTEAKARETFAQLGIDGIPLACDLSELASVRAAVNTVHATKIELDGILANAGIMALPELHQAHGVELQFFTNHVGHFVLTTGLIDRLAPNARVVMVSSGAHRYAAQLGLELENLDGANDYHPWRMYGRSKLANILFAQSLAARFATDGLGRTAYSLHPGVIRTNLTRHIDDAETLLGSMATSMKSIEQGAATSLYVATQPGLDALSGSYFSDCAPAKTLPQGTDMALADELWEATVRLVAERSGAEA